MQASFTAEPCLCFKTLGVEFVCLLKKAVKTSVIGAVGVLPPAPSAAGHQRLSSVTPPPTSERLGGGPHLLRADHSGLADQPPQVSLVPHPGLPRGALRERGDAGQRVDAGRRQRRGVHGQADGGEPIRDAADGARGLRPPAHLCQPSRRDLGHKTDKSALNRSQEHVGPKWFLQRRQQQPRRLTAILCCLRSSRTRSWSMLEARSFTGWSRSSE